MGTRLTATDDKKEKEDDKNDERRIKVMREKVVGAGQADQEKCNANNSRYLEKASRSIAPNPSKDGQKT